MNRTFRHTSLFVSALALACMAMPASAQDKPAAAKPAAPRPDPAANTFKAWDKDRNGNLSLVEFRAGWQQVQQVAEVQGRLRQQFGRIDADDSGAIEAGEYGSLMLVKKAGQSAPPLARFDADATGKLEFDEYLQLVQALAPRDAGKARSQ